MFNNLTNTRFDYIADIIKARFCVETWKWKSQQQGA